MTAFEYVMSNGGAAYDGAGPSNQQQQQEAATTSNVSSEVCHWHWWPHTILAATVTNPAAVFRPYLCASTNGVASAFSAGN